MNLIDRTGLLTALKARQEEVTKDLLMPTKPQKTSDSVERTAAVFLQRMPDAESSTKKAPYILNAMVNSNFIQPVGQQPISESFVRSVFCVYNADGQEGGLMLLNLMDRIRVSLQKNPVLNNVFVLDMQQGIQDLCYPDDTTPYHMGEMITVWRMPPVEREVQQWL